MTTLPEANPTRSISILPDFLINQIAAGEVVERPSSVVKELVENAIDAKATKVEIRLLDGGMSEIIVLDNGTGITLPDLPLSISRHGTSKIQTAEDLEAIHSLGFRGEALSSIASVSNLQIKTRTVYDTSGYQLEVDCGACQKPPEPCSAPIGTRVRVRSLFQTVPARLKFLRTASTELIHCSKILKEIALGHPHIEFVLAHQERQLFRLTKGKRDERVTQTLKWKKPPLHLKDEMEGVRLESLISADPTKRGEIYFLVNNRSVKNRALLTLTRNLIRECFGLDYDCAAVFYLDMPREWVDVNVHPQKSEVRLWKQERVLSWVRASLRKALQAYRPAPSPPTALKRDTFAAYDSPGDSNRLLGVSQQGYFVMESSNQDLLILDPASARTIQTFHECLAQREHGIPCDSLSPAVVVPIPTETKPRLSNLRSLLKSLGFGFDDFGEDEIALNTRPYFLSTGKSQEAFLGLLKDLPLKDEDPFLRGLKSLLRWLPTWQVEENWPEWPSILATESKTGPSGERAVWRLSASKLGDYFGR